MSKLQIPHDAIVFVGDGRKALFLRNAGDERFLNLTTERVFVDENPPTREQGSDKPGRSFANLYPGRSAVEQTDWHELEQHRFADKVSAELERLVRERQVRAIVVAAPPRTLADLRENLHKDVRNRIVAELDKDLTHQPLGEIEKYLVG